MVIRFSPSAGRARDWPGHWPAEGEMTEEEDLIGATGAIPTCSGCGSDRVVRDAWGIWNPDIGLWELHSVFDEEYCLDCDAETSFVWRPSPEARTEKIRRLNDALRRGEGEGRVMITAGIQAMGQGFVTTAIEAVRAFDGFDGANDPHQEHDFGALEIEGEKVFWKIDAYDRAMAYGSPDPTDPAVTTRVLTIMMAHEC